MKSIKFLKVTAVVMTLMMLFSIVNVFADAAITAAPMVQFSATDDVGAGAPVATPTPPVPTQDPTNTVITVSGNGYVGDMATITVYYPSYNHEKVDAAIANNESIDGMIAGMVQYEIGSDARTAGLTPDSKGKMTGLFSVTITLKADAVSARNYTIVLSTPTESNKVIDNFIFGNPTEKAAAIGTLNDAAALASHSDAIASIKQTIANYYDLLGADAVLYAGALDKDNLAEMILTDFKAMPLATVDDPDTTDVNELVVSIMKTVDRINKASLLESFNAGTVVLEVVPEYAAVYFDPNYPNYTAVYHDFTSGRLSDAGKAAVLANISGKGHNTIPELQEAFLDQVVLQGINNPGNPPASNIIHFMQDYLAITELNLTGFNKLSSTKKSEVAIDVMNAKATDFNGVQKALDAAVKKAGNQDEGDYSNPSHSSGSPDNSVSYQPTPSPTIAPPPSSKPGIFVDMAGYEWAMPAVEYLVEKGVVSGYGDTFKPGNSITREEFVKMAVLAFYEVNKSATSNFSDVPSGEWYYEYVSTAVEKSITKGIGDGKFGVGLNITRQDMAVLLYNIAVNIGTELDTTPVAFSDDDQIADYAKNAVYALKNKGIVKGSADNQFMPVNTATRAEAAQMIYGMMKALGK